MKRASRPFALLSAVALAAMVAILGSLSLQREISGFQPLGFAARQTGGGWQVTGVTDLGTSLEVGDQILIVDGDTAGEGTDLGARLRKQSSAELIALRDGVPTTLSYQRPPLDIDYGYLVLALLGFSYLLIGTYTLLKDRRRPARLFYLWCLASAALYLVTAGGVFDGLGRSLYLADEVARLLLPALTLHLFLIFPRPLAALGRFERAIPFLYLPAAVLLAIQGDLALFDGHFLTGAPTAGGLMLLDRVELGYFSLLMLAAVAAIAWRVAHTREPEAHRQVQWLAVGLAGGYLPFVALYVLPQMAGLAWPEPVQVLTLAPLALVPVTFAWAILRYRLWDIGILVRNTSSAALTVMIGVFGFSLANVVVNRVVPEDFSSARNLLVFGSGLLLAGVLVPTRRHIGRSLERLQYGSAFQRRRALLELGRELTEERDLDSLCSSLLDHLRAGLDLDQANLFLTQVEGGGILMSPVRPARGLPAKLSLESFGAQAWEADYVELTAAALPQIELTGSQRLFRLGFRYAVPLRVRHQKVGMAVFGRRVDGTELSSDDLDLVVSLLNQASLAIENARLLDQVQQQLHEVLRLQEFSQNIIESSPAGIAVLGDDGTVVSCNLGFAALIGVERAASVGRPIHELLPRTDLPTPGGGLRQFPFENAQGETHHLQASRARIEQGRRGGLDVLVIQDVSDRVTMENTLREKERLAALGMLAAGVAHEVNTPITGISSYAQMLLSETPDEDPRHELLLKVERQTFRAARIVNNLLDFARERASEMGAVEVERLLDESVELLRERLDEAGVEVVRHTEAPELRILGNEGELQQVFTNLLVNAIDAMSEQGGGTLTLGIEAAGEKVRISVADTGPGIPPEQIDEIFQPFYSTKLGKGGTGLGLSISYSIVRHHRGEIRCDSRIGEGTLFEIDLPRPGPAEGDQ